MAQLIGGIAGLIFIAYAPGWAWSRLFCRERDPLSRHYDRLIASALWSGWLALLLAATHRFSLGLHLLLTALFCAAGLGLARWRGPGDELEAAPPARAEIGLHVALLLLFALTVARPFETILGGRDAGVYPNIGYRIAATGSITQTEPTIAQIARDRLSEDESLKRPAEQAFTNFIGKQEPQRYSAERYTQPSFFINTEQDALDGKMTPGFFHLYPAWIGLWTALFGMRGGLVATGYLGLLGGWSVAMAARRMSDPARRTVTAGFALAFMLLNALQIWFSRYTTAEAGAQMLLWSGLAAWARFADLGPESPRRRARAWYGLLAGLALGQLLLMRLEFYWGAGPLILYLAWQALRRRWTAGESWMAGGLAAMLLHGAIHIRTVAWTYFLDNTWGKFQDFALLSRLVHGWYNPLLQDIRSNNKKGHTIFLNDQRFYVELAVAAVALLALLVVVFRPNVLRRGAELAARGRRPLLAAAIALLVALAGYGYFIRPQHLGLDALIHPIENRALWESYIGAPLPVPFDAYPTQRQRAIVLGNMVRVGWYLSPLGIALGLAGVALWLWRDLNRRTWLVLGVALAYGIFPIDDTYGTAEQVYPYIARRFLPGTIPLFSLGAAWLIGWLATRGGWRRAAGYAAGGLLILFLVATGWRSALHVEYGGALDGVESLAKRIEPDAVVLMRGGDRDTPTNIATPLRYGFNRDALVVYSPDPLPYREQLAGQVKNWLAAGRPVYLLLGVNGGSFNLPGLTLEDRGLFDLKVREWQQLQSQKPFSAGPIRFTYRLYALQVLDAEPTLPLTIDLLDFQYQAGGWYPFEQDEIPVTDREYSTGEPYMWSNGSASLLLPATAQPTTLTLRLGTGKLPPSLQAEADAGKLQVCPKLIPLDPAVPAPALACQAVASPDGAAPLGWALPPLPAAAKLWRLQLDSRTWRPAEHSAELRLPSNDQRQLGVQWYGARLAPLSP